MRNNININEYHIRKREEKEMAEIRKKVREIKHLANI